MKMRMTIIGVLTLGLVFGSLLASFAFTSTHKIPYAKPGSITIDGNLADWSDADWITLDTDYDADPLCIDHTQSAWAAKWSDDGNYIYVAAKVNDSDHVLKSRYYDWDQKDCIEIYWRNPLLVPPYDYQGPWATQTWSQQWSIGVKPDGVSTWATIGRPQIYPEAYGHTDYTPTPAEFTHAGKVDGDWLIYEVKMQALYFFQGIAREDVDKVYPVIPGSFARLDVVATDVGQQDGYHGMVIGERETSGMSYNFNNVAQREIASMKMGEAKKLADGISYTASGNPVTAVFPGAFYIEEEDRSTGIKVVSSTVPAVGDRVTVTGNLVTVKGEKQLVASAAATVTPDTAIISPVGANNKTLYGNGLAMTGMLVKAWGKVVDVTNPAYITIDDGAGSNIKVDTSHVTTRPAADTFVSLTGISSTTAGSGLQANILQNPGFESGITGWSYDTTYWGAGAAYSIVSDVKHSGSNSIRVSADGSYMLFIKSFWAQPGDVYNFSTWIKTQDVAGEGAIMLMEWFTPTGTWNGGLASYPISGTNDWTKVGWTEVVPTGTNHANVYVVVRPGTTGTVWFDDVSVAQSTYDAMIIPRGDSDVSW